MRRHLITLLTLFVLAGAATGCGENVPLGEESDYSSEDGLLGRMFGALTSFLEGKGAEDVPIAPVGDWIPPEHPDDPAVDELFETMGLQEVKPAEDDSLDGALVGVFEHFPDPDDPDDYYDEVCFFAKSPDQQPSQETLFWAEMYGFRSGNGAVSDIDGNPIDLEVVGGDNEGGGETRVIFYVNGVRTDHQLHCDTLSQIADLTGAVTIGVMNESEGWVKDIWQTAWDRFTVGIEKKLTKWGLDHLGEVHHNDAATMLTNVVVQRIRAGKHVEIWAHSQGGAVTSLALHRALRTLEKEGLWPVVQDGQEIHDSIRVVTFGSAAPQWPFGAFPEGPVYTHFVHLRDATPSALGVGALGGFVAQGQPRAGENAQMVFFDGGLEDETFAEVNEEDASVGISELEPMDFHGVKAVYFKMFAQKHGAWEDAFK